MRPTNDVPNGDLPPGLTSRYVGLLRELIEIPSASTEKDVMFLAALREAANWLVTLLAPIAPNARIVETTGHPIVQAYVDAGAATTALIYGHYDVQSPGSTRDWTTSGAFDATERDGRLYGRGAADNKGQILMHIAAAEYLATQRQLGTNVWFVIEGEEEVGSNALRGQIKGGTTPPADCVLISDSVYDLEPTLERTRRGGFNGRLTLTTSNRDSHSGHAGGVILNAAATLAHILSTLADINGFVLVPGFYDAVTSNLVDAPDDAAEVHRHAENLGASGLTLANAQSFAAQVGRYPTLQVSGLSSGFVGNGYRNIVPGCATAQLNVRTVVGQDTSTTWAAVVAAAKAATPVHATLRAELGEQLEAVSLDLSSPWAVKAADALQALLGHRPNPIHAPGGHPMLNDMVARYRDVVSVGLANPDSRTHGGDENISLDAARFGLRWSLELLGQR